MHEAFLFIFLFLVACTSPDDKARREKDSGTGTTGKLLSNKYCGTCHAHVSPAVLDSASWVQHVLPEMAKKLGIGVWQDNQYFSVKNNDSGTTISLHEWDLIVEYYGSQSLKKLPVEKLPSLEKSWAGFRLQEPITKLASTSTTTLVAIDSTNHNIYTSDESGLLRKWNSTLKEVQTVQLPSQGVHMSFATAPGGDGSAFVTCIGNIMATDQSLGSIISTDLTKKDPVKNIVSKLKRPVYASAWDYDKDGKSEIIVCGFGHEDGALSVVKEKTDGSFVNEVLWGRSGALQIENIDYNNDGWMDFVALFGQGDEGIWLFQNNGKGGFESKNLLKFSPLNGSSSFQLYDFNNDGRKDILYTCGDNSDYSRVLKPFHGVYIYLNTGGDQYKEAFFYSLNGCTKAIANDYDKDGTPEIAAIAFFADLTEKSPRSFLYFKEEATLKFKPVEIPVSDKGRWICMDANDIDGDGDVDIVLGNYAKGFINQDDAVKGWNTQLPFIVLENNFVRE